MEKIFLRLYCYPPPGKNIKKNKAREGTEKEPLELLIRNFGETFKSSLKNSNILDIGCGEGDQVIALAVRDTRFVIGSEIRPIYEKSLIRARNLGISNKVKFTLSPIRELGKYSIDIIISQNSFEHYKKPEKILESAYYILKNGGKFFITFSPPWLNPFGVHMFFMIKYPWAHFIFSEKTIMTVRKLYRNDNAEKFEESEGGLNKMTIRKFKYLVKNAGFKLDKLYLRPIKGIPLVTKIPILREFFTSSVSAILLKLS